MLKKKILTVKELSEHIKGLLEAEELAGIWVEGELSNFRKAVRHYYFDLKDEHALLRCVMFRPSIPFVPKNGMKVLVKGDVRVYEKRGHYQLSVRDMKVGGVGELFIAFLKTKEKLQREGLFDAKWKKSLPRMPSTIGVITSPSGAALQDIKKVISRRFPVKLVIAPVRVQGESAAQDIAHAIEALSRREDIDVIILGRGGGRWEDLQPFNEEVVARAIFTSEKPVISAVGHETDTTIADFVADARAPTPSAAAEMAVPDISEVKRWVAHNAQRMKKRVNETVFSRKELLKRVKGRKALKYPYELLRGAMFRFEETSGKFRRVALEQIEGGKKRLDVMEGCLRAMDPHRVLERGYSMCFRVKDNKLFSSIDNAEIGERIKVVIKDGETICTIEEKKRT